MPHTMSAEKRLRKTEKRRRRNRTAAKLLKAKRKEFATVSVGTDAAKSQAEFKVVQEAVDRAAAKGYIHRNKAARLKSRMAKKLKAAAK
jgi:small subunit ribosomal protein S20